MDNRLEYTALLVVFLMVTYSQAILGALFDPCSSDANCTDVNGICNGDMKCVCNGITHYEYGGTCLENCGNNQPLAVMSGTATLTTPGYTTVGSTASVMCGTGYTSETSMITCQATGQWSTVVCNIQNCGTPTSISGGTASPSSTLYGSTAQVDCSQGYENPSPLTITCAASGVWSSASCSRKECGSNINTITNGGAPPLAGNTTYESRATVTCDTGHKDPTPQYVTCQSDGTWSSSSCTIQDCGPPSDIPNGGVSVTETTYQAVATYTCDTGYIISGTSQDKTTTRTCNAIGAWSGQLPVCTVKVNPLGAVCPNPSLTNVPPAVLCTGVNTLCLKRSDNSLDYTCQCDTLYYDNNGDGAGGSCNTISELQVQSITFNSISTTSMTVSWSPPANKQSFVDSYIVEWRDNGNSPQSNSSLVPRTTTYTISNSLTSGRAYTVIVITRNSVDYTSTIKTTFLSKEQAIKPQTPGAINTGRSDLDAEDKYINVEWTGSTGGVSGYEWKLLDNNQMLTYGTTASSAASIYYSGMKMDTDITALSKTFDGNKTIGSDPRTEEIKTVVQVPSSPQQVECHMTTDTSITIKWVASSEPNGDLIDYKIDTFRLGSVTVLKTNRTGRLTVMHEITGLQPVSDIPNNLNVSDVQSRSIMLSWTKPTNTYGENMGYIVQVRTVDDACVMELIITCMGCTQSFNPSSLENMCPNGVSITEQRKKTSIDSDDLQTYTVTSLNPYVNYTVTVTAVTFAGRGRIASVTVPTDEEAPQRPKDVTIVDLMPTSCNVTWDIDGPRPGYTTWEVIVDALLPVTPVSYPLTGFNQRQQVLTGLEEFCEYEVTIRASTPKGRADSDPIQFTTLQAAPGPVQDFDVITSREESIIYVQWKLPSLLQRNGVISSFMLHHNATLNGSTKAVTVLRSVDDSYLYQIELNVTFETVYKIRVYAINTQNENGVETEITKLLTTKSLERNDQVSESNISVVVAAVIAPCVVVVIVVIAVVIIIRRRRRQTLADQMTLSKIHDDTGRVTENHQTTKKITGITYGMEHEEVMAWMHSNEFIACKKHFKHYTGKDMMELSKDDVARICGAADGIRLFNRMRQRTLADVEPRRVSECDLNTHYADLDETARDRVPYENIELNEVHMYSSLNE